MDRSALPGAWPLAVMVSLCAHYAAGQSKRGSVAYHRHFAGSARFLINYTR